MPGSWGVYCLIDFDQFNMKVAVVCFFLALGFAHGGVIPATTFVRAPAHDSAIIKSNRLGGNFAYSTVEGHAYAAISPVVQRVSEPVGVSYTAHPVHLGYAAAPIYTQSVISAPSYPILAAPFIAHGPFIGQAPIVAQTPVADEKPAEQPQSVASDDDSVSVESA